MYDWDLPDIYNDEFIFNFIKSSNQNNSYFLTMYLVTIINEAYKKSDKYFRNLSLSLNEIDFTTNEYICQNTGIIGIKLDLESNQFSLYANTDYLHYTKFYSDVIVEIIDIGRQVEKPIELHKLLFEVYKIDSNVFEYILNNLNIIHKIDIYDIKPLNNYLSLLSNNNKYLYFDKLIIDNLTSFYHYETIWGDESEHISLLDSYNEVYFLCSMSIRDFVKSKSSLSISLFTDLLKQYNYKIVFSSNVKPRDRHFSIFQNTYNKCFDGLLDESFTYDN